MTPSPTAISRSRLRAWKLRTPSQNVVWFLARPRSSIENTPGSDFTSQYFAMRGIVASGAHAAQARRLTGGDRRISSKGPKAADPVRHVAHGEGKRPAGS